jgi:hypothetical protein
VISLDLRAQTREWVTLISKRQQGYNVDQVHHKHIHPYMPELIHLPTEVITIIGSFLESSDVGFLRLANQELKQKMSASFCLLLKTVKVSLIGVSIRTLSDAAWCKDIAGTIEHLIIGTESLERYHRIPTTLPNSFQEMLAGEGSGSVLRLWLQNIIVHQLPKLHTITLEDCPEDPTSETFRSSMGSTEILHKTGVDLRWNGPYTRGLHHPTGQFPDIARMRVYTSVFDMLRYLDTHNRAMGLRIIMRGYPVIGDDRCYMDPGFNVWTDWIRGVLKTHLSYFAMGKSGREYVLESYATPSLQRSSQFALLMGLSISADGRFLGREVDPVWPDEE